MSIASYLKVIGRGRDGARSLEREHAEEAERGEDERDDPGDEALARLERAVRFAQAVELVEVLLHRASSATALGAGADYRAPAFTPTAPARRAAV